MSEIPTHTSRRTKLLIAILFIAIIVLSAALSSVMLSNFMADKQQSAFQQGYDNGATAAILTIIQQSRNCQLVPLLSNNITYTMVDVSCVQQSQQ